MVNTEVTSTEGIAQSLVPHYLEGYKKAAFLGYLVAGFSRGEAAKLVGIHRVTVARWELDPLFTAFLDQLAEKREQLSNQLLDIEYTRNFKLVLAKDFKVLF